MPSTKILLTAAAACFLFALAVPTVAITVGEDTTADDVVLEPTSSYSTIEDGDLRLDLEKLNDRAITRADGVFTIAVNDDAVERIWIENEVDGLEFYADGDRSATVSASNPLEPTAGQTTSIGVAIDTHLAESGTETFTIHVRYEDDEEDDEPTDVELEAVELDRTTVGTGDTVTVNATYRNDGAMTRQRTATLTVDGITVDTKTFEIGPGETTSVVFERELQWPGTYEIGVDGRTESVTAEGPPIDVLDASVADSELTVGETTTVEATVRNPTERRVDRTLELAVDGIVVDTRTVTLEPNSERMVTFDRQFTEPGTYAIAVSGVKAGSITVEEPEPFTLQNRELSAATTAALAPPMTAGFLFLAAAANRRWALVSR
ncbi:CARDB domain-containing protein [Natronorubrum aibiense]|uniref:CARDB domain-containing protein n=1 Tax=Natronorubrum aibiense TaxID=348826 RepID=A0A5P9P3N9_9EURY|nr:CARDB domain-containing protein [Natronorubrum aibiense]QFU82450.1 hypothetical protein GCU68_07910 [Natronorubrum aibiense]